MEFFREAFDIIVIGGGHAGCEAALASARKGMKTLMLAISLDSIAMMPCNPNIGGTSKGHLVREIDALGGEMAKNIDKTFLQSRMLNTSKGPAVHSLRAQADKSEYTREMKKTLENTGNLFIIQGEAEKILTENGVVTGVLASSGAIYVAKAVILCTGTYLRARCLYGETIVESGPNGLKASYKLSCCLKELGIELMRFKTGTPARIDRRYIDFDKMVPQYGDEEIIPFSFDTEPESAQREQIPCHMTYTNTRTHEIIRESIHRAPMYSGVIEGTGTRYCPSIEDKIMRFADKERHQLFIEPEGAHTNEMYVQGMSSSLPEDVQLAVYRSIAGLENCRFMRTAYAIEYDCIDATQLKLSLEFKDIKGLYSAGQLNGSSGYEEAAAQGIIAGINAAESILGSEPLILDRSEAYIGVLIDDLVTKGSKEPYRMMTSRAEYRLLLRQDNADLRLREKGYVHGLISREVFNRFLEKKALIEAETERVKKTTVKADELTNAILAAKDSAPITESAKLAELIKRPEITYFDFAPADPERKPLPKAVCEQVNIIIKYEGYIKRQTEAAEKFKGLEKKRLPDDFDYSRVYGMSNEARQKLSKIKPSNLGQASRITGVSPADISVLMVFLKSGETRTE